MSTEPQTKNDIEDELQRIVTTVEAKSGLTIQERGQYDGIVVIPTGRSQGNVQLFTPELTRLQKLGYELDFVGSWKSEPVVFYFREA